MYAKRLSPLFIAAAGLLWAGVSTGQAQVGTATTYQGLLTDAGELVNDAADIDFMLYDAETAGEMVGAYKAFGVPVVDGLFNVDLDFGEGVFQGDARWLEITVHLKSGDDWITLSPRQPIRPAPYALYALDGAGGGGSSPWSQNGYIVYYNSGNVGIGTATPSSRLSVLEPDTYAITGQCTGEGTEGHLGGEGAGAEGSGPWFGVLGTATGASGTGVSGEATATAGSNRGVYGRSYSTIGRGVYGYASAGSGQTTGVLGECISIDGYGVWGYNDNDEVGTNKAVGVYGSTNNDRGIGVKGYAPGPRGAAVWGRNPGIYGRGVLAEATGSSGSTYGLEAYACSPNGYGVYSFNEAESGNAIAIQGDTASPDGFGGYFNGKGYFSGNVGIGTTTPASPLTVSGIVESTSGGFKFPDGTVQTTAGGGGGGYWLPAGSDIYFDAGNVGIGTTSPQHPLHAVSDAYYTSRFRNTGTGGAAVFAEATAQSGTTRGVDGYAASPMGTALYGFNEADSGDAVGVRGDTASPTGIGVKGTSDWGGIGVLGKADGATGRGVVGEATHADGFGGYFLGKSYFSGRVGIGIETPSHPLHVVTATDSPAIVGHYTGQNSIGYLGAGSEGVYGEGPTGVVAVGENIGVEGFGGDTGVRGEGDVYGVHGDCWNGIGVFAEGRGTTTANPALLIENFNADGIALLSRNASSDVNAVFVNQGAGDLIKGFTGPGGGDLVFRVTNDGTTHTNVLQINGGSDLAEKFDFSGQAEPGMVVAIDPDNPGKLCLARGVYNRCVAGVVSGANGVETGMVLANLPGAENSRPVALSGRVWVHCDATGKAIEPGDLLTTAERPGHAMAVTDHARAQGAVIGKAMSRLAQGETGMVLVLVNLQ